MTAEKDIEEAFQLRLPATDILKHKDDLKKLRHAKPEKFREFAERAIALGARQFSDDDPEVQEQFTHYSPYLDTPRILKRFANLYRFYRFTQWSRELQGFQTATPSELGSWLVTMLRWPQIVRWIQWPGKTQRKIGHTSLEKARHFDSMIKETDSFEEWIEQMDGYDLEHIDGIKDKRLYDFWSNQQQKNHSLSRAVEVGIW